MDHLAGEKAEQRAVPDPLDGASDDRLTSGAHHLIIEGPSHRQRQRVILDETSEAQHAH